MELVKVEIEVPKESKEVIDLLVAIVAKVKAKAPIAEYTELFDELFVAVEGVQHLPAEAKSEHLGGLIAYSGEKIAKALLKPAAQV